MSGHAAARVLAGQSAPQPPPPAAEGAMAAQAGVCDAEHRAVPPAALEHNARKGLSPAYSRLSRGIAARGHARSRTVDFGCHRTPSGRRWPRERTRCTAVPSAIRAGKINKKVSVMQTPNCRI